MNILGLHSGATINQHDPGAALVCDGVLVAACEEERLLRIKSPRGFLPIRSIKYCLEIAGLRFDEIDLIIHPGTSHKGVADRIEHYLTHYFGSSPKIRLINHQLAHIAGAYYASDFDQAMCMSYDSYGDQLSGATAIGDNSGIKILDTIPHNNSLGTFYGTMTIYLGFLGGEDEYKVMGLAAYGKEGVDLSPFASTTSEGYNIDVDNMCRHIVPNATVFEAHYSEKLLNLLGGPRRLPEGPVSQFDCDVAFAAQRTLEKCISSLATKLHKETGLRKLCVSGGVALNCVANHVLLKLPFIDEIYICPPATDRGLAFGCALEGANMVGERISGKQHMYLGREYSNDDIQEALWLTGQSFRKSDNPMREAATMLFDGKIIGWFQGRSELGPRALGNRSILADPRRPEMKDEINKKVKFREEFRPFAPSVLEERAMDLFDMDTPSPFMTITYPVRSEWREKLGAVTHVDGTARVQTISRETNPRFHGLVREFGAISSVPVVLNTSFNTRGEPIVETPLDAVRTFNGTGIDALFIGDFVVSKPARARFVEHRIS